MEFVKHIKLTKLLLIYLLYYTPVGGNLSDKTKILTKLTKQLLTVWLFLALVIAPFPAYAFDTSSTNYINGEYYNNLVGDGDFIDINSMSASDIQAFLNSKGGYLANAPSSVLGDGANGRSAAQIIYDTAHQLPSPWAGAFRETLINASVSPRVLLVTLQKEQSLVTNPSYDQRALDCAMGYESGQGCQWMFDNKPNWKGFTNQIAAGAWQLRYNYEIAAKDISWWNTYYSTHYYVGYSRSHSWGNTFYIVTYRNQATAAFLRYTPHVGFGNYNAWQLLINYFNISPINLGGGTLDINDTETIIQTTYRTIIKVAGTKESGVTVYYGSTLLANTGTTSWSIDISTAIGKNDHYIDYKSGSTIVAQKKITIDRRKVGDVNGDGKIDLLDVSIMSNSWGLTVKDDASINLNPEIDNIVDLLDISLLGANYEG